MNQKDVGVSPAHLAYPCDMISFPTLETSPNIKIPDSHSGVSESHVQ